MEKVTFTIFVVFFDFELTFEFQSFQTDRFQDVKKLK